MSQHTHAPVVEEEHPAEKHGWRRKGLSRRRLLSGAAGAAAVATLGRSAVAQEEHEHHTEEMDPPASAVGQRSPFVQPQRLPVGEYPQGLCCSLTPLGDLDGIITPSDLHYERHHNGVPTINPQEYKLLVHGMVDRPMVFTLGDLQRYPRISRIHFLECSGNSGGHYQNPQESDTAQTVAGLTSNSDWVGIPLAHLFREVGLNRNATWALFESYDGAFMTRSWPMEYLWDRGFLAIGQNGEPLRPEQGYPVRLLVPGTEGNANIKWLRRIEFSDQPWQTREETSKYSDIRCSDDGECVATQFSFPMDAKSLITFPSGGQTVPGPGRMEIRGVAWSGRGAIAKVEVSTDNGETWGLAQLAQPVLDRAHTRFRYLWDWDGSEATIMSRAIDETGYIQPFRAELLAIRGEPSQLSRYHSNQIFRWRVRSDGTVVGGDAA